MKDLKSLSYRELQQLEQQIKKLKEERKDLRVYKVTFYVGFLANQHETQSLNHPDDFGDYFANRPSNLIVDDFFLCGPEEVSGCDVVELEPEDFPKMFRNQ
jgi:hypothetical protein